MSVWLELATGSMIHSTDRHELVMLCSNTMAVSKDNHKTCCFCPSRGHKVIGLERVVKKKSYDKYQETATKRY